jgi:hypothetical protein
MALVPGFGDVSQNLVGQPIPLADKHGQAEILQVLDLIRRAYGKASTSFHQLDLSIACQPYLKRPYQRVT